MTAFSEQLGRALIEEARQRVLRYIESSTLKRSLTVIEETDGTFRLHVPHYWALYYHDGRGPVRARPGHWIVFFKRIEDDPRIRGGADRPERDNQVRRLTKAQFRAAMDAGKIIAVKRVRKAKGNPFFTKGLRGFAATARRIVAQRTSQQMKLELKDILRIRETITFRL